MCTTLATHAVTLVQSDSEYYGSVEDFCTLQVQDRGRVPQQFTNQSPFSMKLHACHAPTLLTESGAKHTLQELHSQ